MADDARRLRAYAVSPVQSPARPGRLAFREPVRRAGPSPEGVRAAEARPAPDWLGACCSLGARGRRLAALGIVGAGSREGPNQLEARVGMQWLIGV